MANLDAIWARARDDLVIACAQGDEDLFLWEHSVRVARNAQLITRLPDVSDDSLSETVIVVAALYHDAGWAVRFRDGEVQRCDILVRPAPETHPDQGAMLMESSLAKLVSAEVVGRAANVIRSLKRRDAATLEARIVADADNLDEFGALALWPNIRRGALDGRGVQAALDTWRRRKEYQFWTARLNDSFHFGAVREFAQKRLEAYEKFMEALEIQHLGKDLPGGPVTKAPVRSAESIRE